MRGGSEKRTGGGSSKGLLSWKSTQGPDIRMGVRGMPGAQFWASQACADERLSVRESREDGWQRSRGDLSALGELGKTVANGGGDGLAEEDQGEGEKSPMGEWASPKAIRWAGTPSEEHGRREGTTSKKGSG